MPRTFRVYDLNGDGVITKNEMGNVVVGNFFFLILGKKDKYCGGFILFQVAVYELMGIGLKPPVMRWSKRKEEQK